MTFFSVSLLFRFHFNFFFISPNNSKNFSTKVTRKVFISRKILVKTRQMKKISNKTFSIRKLVSRAIAWCHHDLCHCFVLVCVCAKLVTTCIISATTAVTESCKTVSLLVRSINLYTFLHTYVHTYINLNISLFEKRIIKVLPFDKKLRHFFFLSLHLRYPTIFHL